MMNETTRSIYGGVVSVAFKDDRNGRQFVTVQIQQDGMNYPTNVRSRDTTILQRMDAVSNQLKAGSSVSLGLDVKESPRSEGGFFRDILRVTSVKLDDSPEPQSTPRTAQPSPWGITPWGTQSERISWNSGVNNAFNTTEFRQDEMTWFEYLKVVDHKAHYIDALITRGPMPVNYRQNWYESVGWDTPEAPQEAPEGASGAKVHISSPVDPLDEQGPHPADLGEGVYEV